MTNDQGLLRARSANTAIGVAGDGRSDRGQKNRQPIVNAQVFLLTRQLFIPL